MTLLPSDLTARAGFALALGGLLGLTLTPAMIRVAHARGWLAHPRVDRWHTRTVALMGGIAIIAAFLVAALLVDGLGGRLGIVVGLGAPVLLVLGFVDDRRGMGPLPKLLVELVIASGVVFAGLRFAPMLPELLSIPLTMLWIIGVTNALNLLDNMDGLAGGTGALIAAACALLGIVAGAPQLAVLAAALAGACLGYLPFNYRRARVFMGDAGSLPLGFLVSVLALATGDVHAATLPVTAGILLPVLLCALPIVDTTLVTVSRIRTGRRVSQGGRDHSSHRLVYVGLGETQSVMLLHAGVAVSACLAVWAVLTAPLATMLVATGLLAAACGWWYLLRVDPYTAAPAPAAAAIATAPVVAAPPTLDLRAPATTRRAPVPHHAADAREAALVITGETAAMRSLSTAN